MQALHDRFARVALVVYLCALVVLVFQPQPQLAAGSVISLTDWLVELGAPLGVVNNYRVEFLLNVALFVPLPFLGTLVWPRVRWSEWVVVAFCGSFLIELAQAFFLVDRSATFVDIVSNTLGGLVGAVAGLVVSRYVEVQGRQLAPRDA